MKAKATQGAKQKPLTQRGAKVAFVPKKEKQTDTPEWSRRPFKEFYTYVKRLINYIELVIHGLGMIHRHPALVKALVDVEMGSEKDIQSAKSKAEIAEKEISENYPILNSQAVISLWTALESTIKSFISGIIEHEKSVYKIPGVHKLKIKIGEYEMLSGVEKSYYICERLEQELSTQLTVGVGRYEVLLEVFGYSGSVPKDIKKRIIELHNIRNLLVHRNGVVDKRFRDACPWLKMQVGDKLLVDSVLAGELYLAAINYIKIVDKRVKEKLGVVR